MTLAIVLAGESLPEEILMQVKNYDRVMAVDGGADALDAMGVDFQYWIGDGDSLRLKSLPHNCKTINLSSYKDDTDSEASVKWAVEMGFKDIVLFGGSGKRLDHWFVNLHLLAHFPEIKEWVTPWEMCIPIRSLTSFSVSLDSTVSILPLGNGPWQITSQGLEWPLLNVDFINRVSLSNKVVSDPLILEPLNGQFLVSFPREGTVEHPKVE